MLKNSTVALLVLASSASFAQMMGGPVSTAQYFPLVDGVRHDYVFVSGPRMTASAVMHAGQTWGGASQLTGVHMTFTCKPAIPCADDATDFYRMEPDGMRYFGGDGSTPSGAHFMMTYSSPEWMLKNPVSPGTMMGPGTYQGAEMWQMSVQGMNSLTGPQTHMSSYQAQALETVTTPMGTFTNALHVREQRGAGYARDVWYAPGFGMVRWMDGAEEALIAKVTLPTAAVPAVVRVVEYYNSGLDHYFVTANPAEIDALDNGQFAGWERTALSFNVIDAATAAARMGAAVCRYYGSPTYGLDSHFYSASQEECAAVQRQWPDQWLLESSNVFQVYMPDTVSGACPAGTLPIYRAWNQRSDTNHRYTLDARVQSTMMGRGFVAEGYGDTPVAMCSPH